MQTCERQSLFAPQLSPVPQFGEQVGTWQTLLVQSLDPQSPLLLQAFPLPQVGAQAGVWQSPDMQIPEPQSLFRPHGAPAWHFPGCVAHGGDWHLEFDPHTNDEQFEALLHNDPYPQLGEQAGGAHRPCTQTFDPQSLSAPHGLF